MLLDKENAVLIGTAIDELIRHHPSLKPAVFEAVRATLAKIEELGKAFVIPPSQQHWYNLVPVQPSPDNDIAMESIEEVSQPVGETVGVQDDDDEEIADRSHDNEIVSYIDIIGRVSALPMFCGHLFIFCSSLKAYFNTLHTAGTLFR